MLAAKKIPASTRPEVCGAPRARPATASARGRPRPMPTKTTTTTVPAVSPSQPRPLSLSRQRATRAPLAAATPPEGGDRSSKEDIERILRSLETSSSSPSKQQQRGSSSSSPLASPYPLSPRSSASASQSDSDSNNNFFLGPPQGRGTFLLVLVNVAVFALATLASSSKFGPFSSLSPFISSLALNHARPHWWQLLTCSFLHLDLQHLAGNLFSLLVFGRDIELVEGPGSVWLYYLITAFFASLASLLFGPKNAISLGASGAVFGLFAVAVAGKISFNLRSLVESAVLASFVVPQVLSEVKSQALGGAMTASGSMVGHVAHLGGAAAGVLVVLLLSRLPASGEKV